jgi:flagellar biosynthesis protein FlhF
MTSDIITPFPPPPGMYRFQVGNAHEAVATIRQRLGDTAQVTSVRPLPRSGWQRWWGAPRFEVIAELPPPAPISEEVRGEVTTTREIATANLAQILRRAGFSESLMGRLESRPGWRKLAAAPLHRGLAEVSAEFARAGARPVPPLPARVAFLGAPGAGRTTALCKWLAREVLERGCRGAVWRVEFDRPNPTQHLDVFCEALGVTAEHYVPGISAAEDYAYVLADVPALPLRAGREDGKLRAFLADEGFTGRILVLNAAYAGEILRASLARARDWNVTHVVFTHLDEVLRWGQLAEFVLDADIPTLFLGLGPALTGEIELEAATVIGRRAFTFLHQKREDAA